MTSDSLFPEVTELNTFPSGFNYVPQFLSEIEEATLLQYISELEFHPFQFQGFEAKRRVVSFGHDYNFESRKLSKGMPIPIVFEPLIAKVSNYVSVRADFVEVLITEYPLGSMINWHRDAPPFKLIAGISLMADCVFRFRPHNKILQGRKSVLSLPVQRRSLYIMQGESRTDWQHSIIPVTRARYSITLRTLN